MMKEAMTMEEYKRREAAGTLSREPMSNRQGFIDFLIAGGSVSRPSGVV